eukprot:GHRR01008569.1.p1 GENE.GHRR01008569.1~~GHRR01008569.1.p1  ORF type:complete len:295 (+),score=110.93 GHRR01008569.1:741-1625(+)
MLSATLPQIAAVATTGGTDDSVSALQAAAEAPAETAVQSPKPPATPLEQRQWRRSAQRSVRHSVTAFKDAVARIAAINSQGMAHATQLTNNLLTERYMPGLALPAVLKGVQGLQQAATRKLQCRQLEQFGQLQQGLEAMHLAVQDMNNAALEARSQLPFNDPASWQHSIAVFHTLSLPESLALFEQILGMYQQELSVKQGILEFFSDIVQYQQPKGIQPRRWATNGSSLELSGVVGADRDASSSRSGIGKLVSDTEELRMQLTVAITAWKTQPCIEEATADQLLCMLTDEMTGF